MVHSGRIAFGEMEVVVFGRPAAEVVAEEARQRDAERVLVMASSTLNRTTDEVTKVRRALSNRFAGLFDRMPPHTPRRAARPLPSGQRARRRSRTAAMQRARGAAGHRADHPVGWRVQRHRRCH